ncbi:type I restriction enzyme, R subunit [Schleiferia thermophila str. Yellowstone]|uniref:type I restriction endonuclease subunit R n=1 Tax=Schleiferia thermophila TaxID=884107 RepID=UPI0004E71393|nr:type I restriction endonuclease [Schleiferia thermophila]KFD40044.1 type I restriction enzyme, R subunit [Schleiferia thermophila str. Yellowstone]
MTFNEDSRVKIPAIVNLTRLGFTYVPKSGIANLHSDTNIFKDLFKQGLSKINGTEYSDSEIDTFITELNIQLDNSDLGKAFYKSLQGEFACKLIDFENFKNNLFHVVTELTYKNDEEEFRPDITLLINGMPLAFIEVKKPNNREGILAERNRINTRFKNPKFKKFMNITQLLVFSNNQEYDEENITPIQGAFYATPDPEQVNFNCFREEDYSLINHVPQENIEIEKQILRDNNIVSIFGTEEYKTAKDPNSPTNRILTSLFSRDRLKFLLRYGIAYVNTVINGVPKIEKHVMRYPQLFATLAIEKKLNDGVKKGIIWHTQGSGKTALAYYNVNHLKDYYQKQNVIAKFYFIVDRLDLANQAKNEFEARGLKVEMVSSKEDFVKNIRTTGATAGNIGAQTITVVNIQKFSDESISQPSDYDLNIQRIYFLDEVHRSYNPKGSFLSNLITSDRQAVLIGLTGTPIISKDYKSKDIFGDYIHTYYYNQSIADGYTLKLIREAIETTFKAQINQVYDEIVKQGEFTKSQIFAHPKFVEPLVNYIIDDFKKSRVLHNDQSIGGMIVCDTSDQAKMIFSEIQKYNKRLESQLPVNQELQTDYSIAAEARVSYLSPELAPISAALILHDVDTKEIRKEYQTKFKQGEIDLLVVYNMLLTGFDARRLKKLYLTRVVKEHNLLQTLTRVNRPYKNFKYGYVVDFADIRKEFDKTNREYFKELQQELGDETKNYSNLFKSAEEIDKEIQEIKEKLFLYDFSNLEDFQKIVSQITDKKEITELKKCLENLKNLYNVIKIMGYTELLNKFSFDKVNKLYNEVTNRLEIINLKENLESATDNTNLLNIALENIQFTFKKIATHELQIADKFRSELERTRKEMERNFDKKDPKFITLFEELKRIFKKKNIEELTSEEMDTTVKQLETIFRKVNELNLKDQMLAKKYENDEKYVRIHKRINENNKNIFNSEIALHQFLLDLKHTIDFTILNNINLLDNQDYFVEQTKRFVLEKLEEKNIRDIELIRWLTNLLVNEYYYQRAA